MTVLATVAEIYERFANHPGWPSYEHHQAWLDLAVRHDPYEPREAAAAWGRRTVQWLQERGLDHTLCIVTAAALLGDPTPDDRWHFLEEGDEPVCHPRCTLCQTVARP